MNSFTFIRCISYINIYCFFTVCSRSGKRKHSICRSTFPIYAGCTFPDGLHQWRYILQNCVSGAQSRPDTQSDGSFPQCLVALGSDESYNSVRRIRLSPGILRISPFEGLKSISVATGYIVQSPSVTNRPSP